MADKKENIVPFLDHAAKRANDVLMERIKGVAANQDRGGADDGNPNIAAIEQMLAAMEGMQTQLQALTDLVIAQDMRLRALEKAKSKIIQVRS